MTVRAKPGSKHKIILCATPGCKNSFYAARKRYLSKNKVGSGSFINLPLPILPRAASVLFAEVGSIKLYQAVPAEYLKTLVV